MIFFTISSPVKISTSTKSTYPVCAALILSSAYASGSIAFSPPSLEVRKVIRIGIFPSASRSSFKTSSTLSNSKTCSNQSTRHSTTSTGMESNVFASSIISFFVTPTIGTMILGAPAPISISLTLTVFIFVTFLLKSLESAACGLWLLVLSFCLLYHFCIADIYEQSKKYTDCSKDNVHNHNLCWLHFRCCCKDCVVAK